MSFLLSAAALTSFILLDLFFLDQQDRALFRRLFPRLSWPGAVYGAGLLGLCLAEQRWADLPAVVLFFLVSVYVFRRVRFKKRLPPGRKDPESLGLRLALVLDFFDILLWWFLGMTVCGVGLNGAYALFPGLRSSLGEVVFYSVLSPVLLVGLIAASNRKYAQPALCDVLGLRRRGLPLLRLVVLPMLAGLAMAGISAWWLFSRPAQPETPLSHLVESTMSPWVLAALMMSALFLAPFLEEILFRGYLFFFLEKVRGRLAAVVVITLLFASLHVEQYWGDWPAITMVGVLGLLLTLLRLWARSTLPGIAMHFTYNTAMVLIPVFSLAVQCPAYYEFKARGPDLDYAEQVALLKRSVASCPRRAEPYNDLAWTYAEKGENLPAALGLVDKALSLQPGNYAFLDTRAEVLYKMGRVKEAVAIAEGLVRDYPDNAYSRQQLDKFKKGLPQ